MARRRHGTVGFRSLFFVVRCVAIALVSVVPAASTAAASEITRTPSGRPDLSGSYDISTLTPLERPARYGDRLELTADEAAAIKSSEAARIEASFSASDPGRAVPFDRKNVIGLHHLALKVADADVLESLRHKLSATDGVEIEFAPEPLGDGPARHMMCTIPGGIRMELIALPS